MIKKTFNIKLYILIFLFLWLKIILLNPGGSLFAQEKSKELSFVNPWQESLTLPFQFINNLIIIPVRINNSDTLRFILDTGLNTTIITELATGDSLLLNYARKITLAGLGKGQPVEALHSYNNHFDIAGIKGLRQNIYVLLENNLNLSSELGVWIHGLTGHNVFKHFIIEINYEKELITFHKPETYRYKRLNRRTVILPLLIHNSKPYIQTTIIQNDGTVIPVKLLIDTGAGHALWLDLRSHPQLKFPENTIESFLGRGLNGEIYGKMGRIKKLYIDKFELKDVIASYPDSLSLGKAIGLDERNGSLGSEVLRRFKLIIDYSNKQISFIPNNLFLGSFKHDMSGMQVTAPFPKLPYYTILDIQKDSPADHAGLKIGDEIIADNNIKTSKYKLPEIRYIFRQKEGRKIKIKVSRNGKEIKTNFILKKII